MAHSGGAPTTHAGHSGPRPASMLPTPHHDRAEKRDLTSWWKSFKSRDREKKPQDQPALHQGIFGVPLQQSIRYANVAISLLNEEGQSYIYGYVPIVVAKCGVFLKEKATDVEGIFRLAGSEKRIKELKVAFDSPDRFGKGLDWAGYTVHDAANILRRYFNQLPEPIIPLEFYQPFRDPLRNHQAQAVGALDSQSPSVGDFDQDHAIRIYQRLITELPPLNRQLLLYILDLLAVFASKSDLNKMTTANLAAIFQPGILSHPQHDMAPQEYRLSQDVLIFLIENQDSFLIGMQGTGVDEDTIKEVQSGAPTPSRGSNSPGTPTRSRTVIGRSASNASAGAESIRRWGSLRRNVSVSSSKHSKRSDGGPVPVGAPSTPTSGGVHRSNTVPSRRGGSNSTQNSPRFSNRDSPTQIAGVVAPVAAVSDASRPPNESLQSTPVAATAAQFPPPTVTQPPEVVSPTSSEATTPLAMAGGETFSSQAREYQTPKKDTTPLLAPQGGSGERTSTHAPSASSGRGFLDIFKQSPTSDSEGQRKPNKLQKRRIPGSSLSSAQSSNHDLHDSPGEARSPIISAFPNVAPGPQSPNAIPRDRVNDTDAPTLPPVSQLGGGISSSTPANRESTSNTLRAASPTNSYRSTNEDTSDADFAGDDLPRDQTQQGQDREKKRHRWRFSRTQNRMEPSSSPPSGESLGAAAALGSKNEHTTSRSTVGSSSAGGNVPRRSFQEATPLSPIDSTTAIDPSSTTSYSGPQHSSTMQSSSTDRSVSIGGTGAGAGTGDAVFSDSEREKGKGPMRWIRGKIQEHKDKEAERRARSAASGGGGSFSHVSGSPSNGVSTYHQQQQQQQESRGESRDRMSQVVAGGAAPPVAAAAAAVAASGPTQPQTSPGAPAAAGPTSSTPAEMRERSSEVSRPDNVAAPTPPTSVGSTIIPGPTTTTSPASFPNPDAPHQQTTQASAAAAPMASSVPAEVIAAAGGAPINAIPADVSTSANVGSTSAAPVLASPELHVPATTTAPIPSAAPQDRESSIVAPTSHIPGAFETPDREKEESEVQAAVAAVPAAAASSSTTTTTTA